MGTRFATLHPSFCMELTLPIVVDHEKRRADLVDIAANMIGRYGMKGATIRAVAAAAGYSTKAVTHYFADKSELMFRVYSEAAQRAQVRFDNAVATDPCNLQLALEALLPLDAETLRDWKIFIGSWDLAFEEGIFLDRQLHWHRNARRIIAEVLAARRAHGLTDHADPAESPRLLMIVMGIASQAIFDETLWSPANQRRVLADELGRT